ncbi:Uncharacterised protein [Mycobacteroides abscessus subsp. abscessus]|nr:Uncharacterised protein [Mycobacteroides abscessus subsp. abscessus]
MKKTNRPQIAYTTNSPGPALCRRPPAPMNRPVPMAPPMPIIWTWRFFKPL